MRLIQYAKKSYRTVALTTSPLLKLSDKFCRYAFSQTTHFDYGGQRYVQIILPHSYMIVIAVILALIAKQRYVPIPVSMKATRIELKRNKNLLTSFLFY